jgi:hypothetical protein
MLFASLVFLVVLVGGLLMLVSMFADHYWCLLCESLVVVCADLCWCLLRESLVLVGCIGRWSLLVMFVGPWWGWLAGVGWELVGDHWSFCHWSH